MIPYVLFGDVLQSRRNHPTVCISLLLVLIGASRCDFLMDPERDAYRRIKMDVLSHPYAVDKIPPKVNFTENIDIEIGFSPQQILFVNEVEMTVTASVTLSITWHEPAFAWDPSNSSIYAVSVSSTDVWRPIFMNPSSIDSDQMIIEMPPDLRVHHTGKIQTVQKVTITVSCPFDMEWYPFDEQRCLFPIMPYNSEAANVNSLSSQEPEISIGPGDSYNKGDWTLEKVTALMTDFTVDKNTDVMKKVSYVNFEVLMKRRSTIFYLTNVIFPMAATAILTLGVFLIPAESGEKISYLISIFISTTVFLSSLSNTMSKGQGMICRFNAFIVAVTVKIILATAASIFVLHRYKQEQEQKEKKGEETTSLTPTKIKNANYIAPECQTKPLGVGGEIDSPRAINSVQLSDETTPRSKSNGSERTQLPDTTSGDELVTVKKRCLKVPMFSVSKYWRKGYRLTSAELDTMFFVIFVVVAITTYLTIMLGTSR